MTAHTVFNRHTNLIGDVSWPHVTASYLGPCHTPPCVYVLVEQVQWGLGVGLGCSYGLLHLFLSSLLDFLIREMNTPLSNKAYQLIGLLVITTGRTMAIITTTTTVMVMMIAMMMMTWVMLVKMLMMMTTTTMATGMEMMMVIMNDGDDGDGDDDGMMVGDDEWWW